MLISVKGIGKNQLEPGQERMEDGPQSSHCSLLKKSLTKTDSVLENCMKKKKSTVGCTFFMVFPSDHILKVTKDVKVHFFIHSSKSCKLYHEIPENF
jgi:hypothetical protein